MIPLIKLEMEKEKTSLPIFRLTSTAGSSPIVLVSEGDSRIFLAGAVEWENLANGVDTSLLRNELSPGYD